MSDHTTVNPQITDAVTQSNVKVMGEAPAMAMGSIYQSLAHSTGLLFENAVAAQQQQAILAQAATNVGVMQLYGMSAAEAGKIAQSDVPDNLLSLLAALRAATGPITASPVDLAAAPAAKPAESGPAA
ncbi:Killing trait [Caulobacter sp. AP07]|uniref:RebB family R body protein n=1 Tax=Caulobacter sp. AP07 TaxID=1144304 RepID=UPI0002720691|nr:RebB family R body protein [Caulobacter sp. AP07]EJL34709.1 Killing trait [Caulobacter sp. AP07]